jgi:hypothetical protein
MGEQLFISDRARQGATLRPALTGLLQRKCACGNHTMSGECDGCAKRRSLLQRKAINSIESLETSPFTNERGTTGEHVEGGSRMLFQARAGHDFSRVGTNSEAVQHRDASDDEEGSSGPSPNQNQIPQTSGKQLGSGTEVEPSQGATPLNTKAPDAGATGASTACPSKTGVDTVTNKAADGVKYRTGIGAIAKIKVDPDSQSWDGTSIVESFPTGVTSDCPKEFGINPCSGNSTFIVGVEKTSPVFGTFPATKNRFYDVHETRWKGGSLLHDRNPGGVDSCKISCEQNYSCGGAVIGKHTITRTFTKGKVGSVDVTNVSVVKT